MNSLFFTNHNIALDKIDVFKYPLQKFLKGKLTMEDYCEACELIDTLCDMAQLNGFKTKTELVEAILKWEQE